MKPEWAEVGWGRRVGREGGRVCWGSGVGEKGESGQRGEERVRGGDWVGRGEGGRWGWGGEWVGRERVCVGRVGGCGEESG